MEKLIQKNPLKVGKKDVENISQRNNFIYLLLLLE